MLPRLISAVSYKVGAKYIQLRLGENRNTYADVFMRAAKALHAVSGRYVRNYGLAWKQGEADLIGGLPRQPEDFRAFMFQYYRQRADATKLALGQMLDPILFIDPAGTVHPDYDQWSQRYPRGLELIRHHPNIRLTGGSYVYPHSDASHLTCASSRPIR
ncbi:hypothetical protein IPV08_12785 [Methylobacterium sp. SD274]|uniref:hypothetical protein n=1 Tax=Methylobacterium sp. SD274 TaxID=2782009 RepID=UPI001A962A54|nr:hypothetical protein [Methylobacterium sp. SD274]MBO1020846.1 hypothetical protein [Methylobacterium sp. SD274]